MLINLYLINDRKKDCLGAPFFLSFLMKSTFDKKIDAFLSKCIKPTNRISFYGSLLTIVIAIFNIYESMTYSFSSNTNDAIIEALFDDGEIVLLFIALFLFYISQKTKNDTEKSRSFLRKLYLILILIFVVVPVVTAQFFLIRLLGWLILAASIYFSFNFFKKFEYQDLKGLIASFNDTSRAIFVVGLTTFFVWLINGLYFTLTTFNPLLAFFSKDYGMYLFAVWFASLLYLFISPTDGEEKK